MVKAVMKKNPERIFIITAFDGETITMYEDGDLSSTKKIKRKTFSKSYRVIEGDLASLKGAAASAEESKAEPAIAVVPGSQLKIVGDIVSVEYQPLDGYVGRVAIVTVSDDFDVKATDEADFIAVLVNEWGAIHGDRVEIAGQGNLGYINLGGDKPKFDMPNPPLVDKNKEVEEGDKDYSKKKEGPQLQPEEPKVKKKPQEEPKQEDAGIDMAVKEEPQTSWNLLPEDPDEVGLTTGSMRASRESKKGEVQPFVPEPFYLRQSMINLYLQCPDKFYETYENGYAEDSIFTKVGTAIHGIMEDYFNDQDNADVPSLFQKWWTEHAAPDWDWYRDWERMVKAYFERLGNRKPNVIATELEFRTRIAGVPVSGTIDRIDRIDERTIEIIDYKTNFRPWTEAELQESIQFHLYSLAVRTEEVREELRKRGDSGEFDTVICTYDMLRLGYRQRVQYDEEELASFARWMKMIWTRMLSGADRKPKLNPYCGHCQKRHRCPLYQQELNSPVPTIPTENLDIEQLLQEREQLANRKKLIDGRLGEVEQLIKLKIAENQGSLVVGEYEWSTKSSPRYHYSTKDVFRVLAMNGKGDLIPDIANISNTALQRALKGHQQILEQIEQYKQVTYTSPSINKKKIKKDSKEKEG